jgi:hypothetical protein
VLSGDDNLLLKAILDNGVDNTSQNDLSREKLINNYVDAMHIKGTKLYWLIERCLKEIPEQRTILYI